jgi:hypothetical protein
MKVTSSINLNETITQYPCLMIDNDNQMIVLFKKAHEGTIISSEDHNEIGKYETDFAMDCFIPYCDKVTLKN